MMEPKSIQTLSLLLYMQRSTTSLSLTCLCLRKERRSRRCILLKTQNWTGTSWVSFSLHTYNRWLIYFNWANVWYRLREEEWGMNFFLLLSLQDILNHILNDIEAFVAQTSVVAEIYANNKKKQKRKEGNIMQDTLNSARSICCSSCDCFMVFLFLFLFFSDEQHAVWQ